MAQMSRCCAPIVPPPAVCRCLGRVCASDETPTPSPGPGTARDVAEARGVRVDEVLHVSRLLGVPVDDANTPAYDEHSCEAVGMLKLARDYGMSESAIEQLVLVLGRHMSRLAADLEVIVGD